MWWQRNFRESSLEQPSDHVKAFREGKLQGCRNSQRKPCLLHYSNEGEASKSATQRLKQSVSCWENYPVRRVWRRCVYVSFDIKKDHPSFSGLLLLVFPFTREKLFALDALHTLLKMKSSETYINRQASPKVVFVSNWSDFRLDCQFMLHVTHVPKAPPLPHMVPKRGTRKQISTVCIFNSLPNCLFSSYMAGQAPALPEPTTNSVRVNWKLSKPWNRQCPKGHSDTHCHSADLERKMSELLIELMSQTDQKINPLLQTHFLSWGKVENPSDSLLSLLAPFCLLQKLPGTSCSSSSLLACTSGTSQWCRKPALKLLSIQEVNGPAVASTLQAPGHFTCLPGCSPSTPALLPPSCCRAAK